MAWTDTLSDLKQELADIRARRQQRILDEDAEIQRERDELSHQAESLGIVQLLTEMNQSLLDGKGEVETIISWELEDGESPLEGGLTVLGAGVQEPEEGDVITNVLTWEEGDDLEITVDLGLSEDGTYLQVNGIEIRAEREALEQGLVQAFRDELEL